MTACVRHRRPAPLGWRPTPLTLIFEGSRTTHKNIEFSFMPALIRAFMCSFDCPNQGAHHGLERCEEVGRGRARPHADEERREGKAAAGLCAEAAEEGRGQEYYVRSAPLRCDFPENDRQRQERTNALSVKKTLWTFCQSSNSFSESPSVHISERKVENLTERCVSGRVSELFVPKFKSSSFTFQKATTKHN